MIDSHCHLTHPDFAGDLDAVISRATDAGVMQIVTISDEIADLDPGLKIAEKYEHIFCTAGVHPHHAKDFDPARDLPLLREAAKHPKCCAIGEIGLDYHYMHSPKEAQQSAFEAQLVLARELCLPAVIHCREAVEDVWTIVQRVKPQKLVIHCCTEAWSDVQRYVDAGYMLSFTGIVTYPKFEIVRETVRRCPIDQLMVETDAPFLAPVPHRGKRCEPMHVVETARVIAALRGMSDVELDTQSTKNALEFYSLRP